MFVQTATRQGKFFSRLSPNTPPCGHAPKLKAPMPAISVIVPMRNEAATIGKCLRSLLSQTIASSEYEIIVVDGISDDSSPEIVLKLQAAAPNLVLLQNPSRTMSAGMNIGLRNASAPIVIVAGAHTSYPSDYFEKCLRYLSETGADVVGGPLVTTPRSDGFAPRMIAAILSSRFGVGNASFRTGLKEGWVDTVPYPAYRKKIFERCGVYSEHLVRAQDCELHARIRQNGGRIYQTPELMTHYHPVDTFRALLSKAFLDGKWQCIAVAKNPHSFALHRFVPALMVTLLAGVTVLSTFVPRAWVLTIGFLLAYLLTGFYFALAQSPAAGLLIRLSLPFCAFPFHLCYGVGTVAGLWHVLREPARSGMTAAAGPLHRESLANGDEKTL